MEVEIVVFKLIEVKHNVCYIPSFTPSVRIVLVKILESILITF